MHGNGRFLHSVSGGHSERSAICCFQCIRKWISCMQTAPQPIGTRRQWHLPDSRTSNSLCLWYFSEFRFSFGMPCHWLLQVKWTRKLWWIWAVGQLTTSKCIAYLCWNIWCRWWRNKAQSTAPTECSNAHIVFPTLWLHYKHRIQLHWSEKLRVGRNILRLICCTEIEWCANCEQSFWIVLTVRSLTRSLTCSRIERNRRKPHSWQQSVRLHGVQVPLREIHNRSKSTLFKPLKWIKTIGLTNVAFDDGNEPIADELMIFLGAVFHSPRPIAVM